MSDVRYILKNGDPTSSGGQLIAVRPTFVHHGVAIGVEGDMATCAGCKSNGPVFNDCYPSWDYHGKQVLVNGAVVHCKCQNHPIVSNTQTSSTVEVNRAVADRPTLERRLPGLRGEESDYWIAFSLHGSGDCEGLKLTAYFSDGSIQCGIVGAENYIRFERAADNVCNRVRLEIPYGAPAISSSVTETILSLIF